MLSSNGHPITSTFDNNKDTLIDHDDTISSSDGSFMPPVLSDYAKRLLADNQVKTIGGELEPAKSETHGNVTTILRSMSLGSKTSPMSIIRNNADSFKMRSSSPNDHRFTTSPMERQKHRNPTNMSSPTSSGSQSASSNTVSSNVSSPGTSIKVADVVDELPLSQQVSTFGITRASQLSNKTTGQELPSDVRDSSVRKRFGRGSLGPPKRTIRQQLEDAAVTEEKDNSNENQNQDSDEVSIQKGISRIRFADTNEEIPPPSITYSNTPSPKLSHPTSAYSFTSLQGNITPPPINQKFTSSFESYTSNSGHSANSRKVSAWESERSSPSIKSECKSAMSSPRQVLSVISPNVSNSPRNRFAGVKKMASPPKTKVEQQQQQQVSFESEHRHSVSSKQYFSKKSKNSFYVNGRMYQRLELLGKGGSSKVFKVQSEGGRTLAVKKVAFEDISSSIVDQFKGEIDLLRRLKNEERVVKLVDYEMFDNCVFLVMECGEIDLAHVLASKLQQPLDVSFVRYYSIEMLKCLDAVHRHGIVHSDLKPANFLLVKGVLKIIDFGIANAVPDYTVNVHRDSQIGTPNYMAPEALSDANYTGPSSESQILGGPNSKYKLGRPSDVWSIGCIIYQMIYGRPPFAGYSGVQRMMAIANPKVPIVWSALGLGDVKVPSDALQLMHGCLERDPRIRLTVDGALNTSFLNPQIITISSVKYLVEHLVQYGAERGVPVRGNDLNQLAETVWKKIQSMHS